MNDYYYQEPEGRFFKKLQSEGVLQGQTQKNTSPCFLSKEKRMGVLLSKLVVSVRCARQEIWLPHYDSMAPGGGETVKLTAAPLFAALLANHDSPLCCQSV